MGILDKLLGRKPDAKGMVQDQPAETQSGWYPAYSQRSLLANIWQSDLAWQCVDRIARECAKITPSHVVQTSDQLYSVNDDVQRVLQRPNELMTSYDMTYKVIYTLFTRKDTFIVPVYEGPQLYGLYPVQPATVDWLDIGGELHVRLNFANGKSYTYPYFAIIHIRKNYGEDDYMGTSSDRPLLSNMQLNEDLLDGVRKGVTSSSALNGIVKYGTALSKKMLEDDVKAFSDQLRRNESGFLGLDNQTDFKEVNRNVKLVDADTLKYVRGNVLNHFGMTAGVLDGTASREEEERWYHATIQPLMECLGQAYSRVLFSAARLNKGHMIRWYSKDRLQWMTGNELNEAIKQLTNVGALQLNQILVAYGFAPLGEEGTVRPMSLNYIDSKYALQYQLEAIKKGDGKNAEDTEDPAD